MRSCKNVLSKSACLYFCREKTCLAVDDKLDVFEDSV